MAIRKMESVGWMAASESTWIPLRWSIASGIVGGSPGRRTGSRYIQAGSMGQTFDNQTTWIVHFAMRHGGSNSELLEFRDAGTAQCAFYYNNSAQVYELRRGGTVLASSGVYAALFWRHVIVKAVIHNTTGEMYVYIDGALAATFTGNTRGGTTNNYANQVAFINNVNVHDIVICDNTGAAPYNDVIGDLRVDCLLPNAAGASTVWTPSAGSNYQNVDDTTPDGDTTYNSTATPGAIDSYALPNPSLLGTCRGVGMFAIMRKDDAGVRTARMRLYDGTAYNGTTVNLADSYTAVEHIWQVHPGTGVPFTGAQLDAAEAGAELVS